MYPTSDDCFQEDNGTCYKDQIISNWFLKHDSELAALQGAPDPDLNPPLGCGGKVDSYHRCATTVLLYCCYRLNIEQNL